jgi:hypothetical protein
MRSRCRRANNSSRCADPALYATALSKVKHDAPQWGIATPLLMMTAERVGCVEPFAKAINSSRGDGFRDQIGRKADLITLPILR